LGAENVIAALLFLGYLALGAYIALSYDEFEMAKQVPYGEYPSIVSLRTLRMIIGCYLTLVSPTALVVYTIPHYVRYRLRVQARARRRFR
jgi:hypothetical protein